MKPLLTIALLICFIIGCSNNPTKTIPNNTTHITTGVKGRLLDLNNNPVSGAIVFLYPVNYIPSVGAFKSLSSNKDTTDENGTYEIANVDTGIYNIEGQKDSLGILIDSIPVVDDTSITNVPPGQLRKLGKITGITHMPGQNDTNQVRVNIYIPGTNRITLPNIGGRFTFDLMPANRYQIIINPTLPTYKVTIIDTTIIAGQTLNLDTVFLHVFEPDTIDIINPSVSGVWGPNKIYRINANLQVPIGSSLHILPNTTLLFNGFFCINVYGSLIAVGKPDSMIMFTYGLQNPSLNGWGGINNGVGNVPQTDTLILEYCVLEYSISGIEAVGQDTSFYQLSHNVFRYNKRCLQIERGINPSIYNNIFHDIKAQDKTGFAFGGYYSNSKITNSIFLRCDYAFAIPKDSLTANYNDFYSVDTLGHVFYNPYSWDTLNGIGNIFQDPLFVSTQPSFEDYHLLNNSPCRASGINNTDMGIYSTFKP